MNEPTRRQPSGTRGWNERAAVAILILCARHLLATELRPVTVDHLTQLVRAHTFTQLVALLVDSPDYQVRQEVRPLRRLLLSGQSVYQHVLGGIPVALTDPFFRLDLARAAARVDDPPASALDHPRNDRARAEKRSEDVHLERVPPVVDRLLPAGSIRARRAAGRPRRAEEVAQFLQRRRLLMERNHFGCDFVQACLALFDLSRDGALADEPAPIDARVEVTGGVVASHEALAGDGGAMCAHVVEGIALDVAAEHEVNERARGLFQ